MCLKPKFSIRVEGAFKVDLEMKMADIFAAVRKAQR